MKLHGVKDIRFLRCCILICWTAFMSQIRSTMQDYVYSHNVTKGDTAFIPCLFGNGIVRNIYWYYLSDKRVKVLTLFRGDVSKNSTYEDRVSLGDDNSTLIIENVDVADNGRFQCDVDVKDDTPVYNIMWDLQVFGLQPDARPNITQLPNGADFGTSCQYNVTTGESTNLTCELRDFYPLEPVALEWHGKNLSIIEPLIEEHTSNSDGTFSLASVISLNVSEIGEHVYTCRATFPSIKGESHSETSISLCGLSRPTLSPENDSEVPVLGIVIGVVATLLVLVILGVVCYRMMAGIPIQDSPSMSCSGREAECTLDDILKKVAEELVDEQDIEDLGKELRFSVPQIERYMKKNELPTYRGTLSMLRKWRKGVKERKARQKLRKALHEAGQINLANRLLPEESVNMTGDT